MCKLNNATFCRTFSILSVCFLGAFRTYQEPKDEEELYVLFSNGTFTCYNLNGTVVTDRDLPGMKVGGTRDDTRVTQQSLY